MKTKLPLLLAIASALGAPLILAQDERPPQRPAPDAQRPPAPPDGQRAGQGQGGPRERRPDGERGPGAPDADRAPGRPDGGRRADGDRPFSPRGEKSGRDGDGVERGPSRAQKPTPFIGVMTSPVPPFLGAQIGLAEGFGLVVDELAPDSPAVAAGVQRYDVLKLLNEQQLSDPGQLAALVRSLGKDAPVTLTILRKGQEQKLSLKIGERMLPERSVAGSFGESNWLMNPLRRLPEAARDAARSGEDAARRMQEQMRAFQQRMGDFQKRMQEWQKNPTGNPPEIPKLDLPKTPDSPAPRPPAPGDLLREARPGGAPQVRVDQDGAVTTWNTAEARVVVKDENGEVELRTENGHRNVAAKNPAGEIVFTGPVDTEDQRKALPEPVRRAMEKMHVQTSARAGAEIGPRESAPRTAPPPARGEREIQ